MRKYFYSILNLEDKEGLSVFLFLIQSVFLGIFYGAFDVGAHALFLTVYPATMIPRAYVISGIAGIILTSLYARIQNRISFSKLAFLNLLFISLSTALLRLLFQFTESNWLIFLIFIMMGPLNIIALLGFWGAVGRIFTLRQGKRLFGLIDSGQIFGAILSTFAIPILIAVGFQQKNLLFLSSVSIIGALLMQLIISFKFNLNTLISKAAKKQKRLPELLKNRYILYMSVFVVLSMLTAFFVQYSFLSVTKENYPDHNDLTEFLGAFTGSLLLFTFLFKTFLYSKLMKTYGLRTSIIISPFLLGIFTVLAVGIGSLWGYTAASASFIFFFLIISLSRLFSKALKDAVEVPSFKILYQSLKVEIRHDVQAYVDGTINEIAALASGLLLAVLGLFEFFTLIYFSYALLIILVVWFFFARKLYAEYKTSLEKSLAEFKIDEVFENDFSDFINGNIEGVNISRLNLLQGLEISSSLNPLYFENNIGKLLNSNNKNIREYAQKKLVDLKLINEHIKLDNDTEIAVDNEKYNDVLIKAKQSSGNVTTTELIKLSKARSTDERILAAYLITKNYNEELFVYLKALIRDIQTPVKIAAIRAVTKLKIEKLCPYIIDYLDSEDLYAYAYGSILEFNETALNYLDLVFYKSGTSHRVLLRILRLMTDIGGEKSKEYLLKKIDHPNEEVLKFVLLGLQKCNFKADESNINKVHQIIENHIGVMAWNLSANYTLSEIEGFNELKDAFNEEMTSNFKLLYLMLSLAYDSQSVMHAKENIESGTSEGASYALELLDLFISDELKPKLFPVVEDISLSEKISFLQDFYPITKLSLKELLLDTINRDVNYISQWTKACAINAIQELEKPEISDDLIAHLFNPSTLLRETSAVVVQKINTERYIAVEERLDENYKEGLDFIFENEKNNSDYLLFQKTLFLKSIEYFKTVQGKYLCQLANIMFEFKSEEIEYSGYVDQDLKDKFFIVKGQDVRIGDGEQWELLEQQNVYTLNNFNFQNVQFLYNRDNATIYIIDKKQLLEIIFDFTDIEISILKLLSIDDTKEAIKIDA